MGYFNELEQQPVDVIAMALVAGLEMFESNLKNKEDREIIAKVLDDFIDAIYEKTKSNQIKLKALSFRKFLRAGYSKAKSECNDLKFLLKSEYKI